MTNIIYAHKNNTLETLEQHENLICEYARKISSQRVVESMGYNYEEFIEGIRFHDRGKINKNFQEMLKTGVKKNGKNTNHSLFSAMLYLQNKKLGTLKQKFLNAYVISKHHSHLNDFNEFQINIENLHEFKRVIDIEMKLNPSNISDKIIKNFKEFTQNDYFYVRYFFSVLGSADIFATQEFMNNYKFEKCESFKKIKNKINSDFIIKNIKNGVLGEGINKLRSELTLEALTNYKGGVSLLEAPTGAGKTKTGYVLAEKSNKEKLFYIAPFNNISTQTYGDLLKIFSNNEVGLINSIVQIKESENENDVTDIESYNNYYQLNSPIVVTSAVHFFDILYSNKKRDILKFYTLENSCVIIDEIQAFNINTWKDFSLDLSFLSQVFNIDFIIMSATLPNLEFFSNSFVKLINNRDYYFKNPYFKNRVEVILTNIKDLENLKKNVLAEDYKNQKILIQFINKKMAYEFYENLKKSIENIFILTGDTKNLERKKILEITENKSKIWSGILIGTQVIEAGIDIDFHIGFKDISILESEEQFAGRINRNSSKNGSKLYFFNCYDVAKLLKKDVRKTESLTLLNPNIFESFKEKDFEKYYKKVLNFLDKREGFSQFNNFKKKYEVMKLITQDSESIFILSKETQDIFLKYNKIYENKNIDFCTKAIRLKNIKSEILENSINIYTNDKRFEKIKEKNSIKYLDYVNLEYNKNH